MFRVFSKIAWFSLSRRKSRSILVIIMIGICFWGILLMEGVYDGMTEQVIDNAIRSSSGHITLQTEGYRLEQSLSKRIEKVGEINFNLKEMGNIKSYSHRVLQDCLVATAHYSQNGKILGIDLDKEKQHSRLHEYLIEGDYSFGKKGKGIILGAKLAKKLKTKLGRKIIISAQDVNNEITALAFKVTGILRTNNLAIDETSVFIDIETAREFLQLGKSTSQITLMLHEQEKIEETVADLKQRLPQLEVLGWGELFPALLQSREMMKLFNLITSSIVFFVAGIGIFGVMLVSVLERLREFGVMLAVGTSHGQIFSLVVFEALFMSLLGYILGGILGGASLYYFIEQGLDLTLFKEGLEAFGIDTTIYAIIRPEYFTTSLAAILFASFVSVLYPLWVLRKSRPIESINRN